MRTKRGLTLLILLALLLSSVTGYTVAKYIKTFTSDEATVTFSAKLADEMTITSESTKLIPGYDDEAYVTYTVYIKKKTEIPATLTVKIQNNTHTAESGDLQVAVDTFRLEASNTKEGSVLWSAVTTDKTTTCTYSNTQLSAKNQDVTITLIVPLTVSQHVKKITDDDSFTVSAELKEYTP